MDDIIASTDIPFLSIVVSYNKTNRSKNHRSNPFIAFFCKNGDFIFKSWDFDILNFYLFTNEFLIEFEFEHSVYSF